MTKNKQQFGNRLKQLVVTQRIPILWSATVLTAVGLLFSVIVLSHFVGFMIFFGLAMIAILVLLVREYRKALTGRAAAYGLNSFVTVVLVLGIVGVANFLSHRYSKRFDLTRDGVHSLSDQTEKVVKGLQNPVRATLFSNPMGQEKLRPLLEGYEKLNPEFKVEMVDPTRETTRTRQLGIKKLDTLVLAYEDRSQKLETVTEESLTNSLIQLTQPTRKTLCVSQGHGEKSFSSEESDGFSAAKKGLEGQSYQVKEVELAKQADVPADCSAVAIMGPNRAFVAHEIKALRAYLQKGGRIVVGLDLDIRGGEFASELVQLLRDWHVGTDKALLVDPVSRLFGLDAGVAVVPTFSKSHAITKDFTESTFFPFARPLQILPNPPKGMKVEWIAQTTPNSWAETNLAGLGKGTVQLDGNDKRGPHTAAIAVEHKPEDPKSKKNRVVVFASSMFANNNFSRIGGNLDFFLNSVSWLLENENLISIRKKEEGSSRIELSQQAGQVIFLLTVILLPLAIVIGGIWIWVRRRKL